MAASKKDIVGWLREAQNRGAAYVIIVCDTFDHEDYPVLCFGVEDSGELRKIRWEGHAEDHGGLRPRSGHRSSTERASGISRTPNMIARRVNLWPCEAHHSSLLLPANGCYR